MPLCFFVERIFELNTIKRKICHTFDNNNNILFLLPLLFVNQEHTIISKQSTRMDHLHLHEDRTQKEEETN